MNGSGSFSWGEAAPLAAAADADDRAELGGLAALEPQLSAPAAMLLASIPESPGKRQAAAEEHAADGPGMQAPGQQAQHAAAGPGAAAEAAGDGGASASGQALRLIWAPLSALALSSTIALTLFPFFTYVPTSGLLGEALPRVSERAGRCRYKEAAVPACLFGICVPHVPPAPHLTPNIPMPPTLPHTGPLLCAHLCRRPRPLPAPPLLPGGHLARHAAGGRGRQGPGRAYPAALRGSPGRGR